MNCICMKFTLLFIEVSKTENEMLRMCECSRVWITTLVLKKKRKGFQTTLWEFTKATKTFIKSILISILLKKKDIFSYLVQPNFLYMSGSINKAKQSCLRGDFRIFLAPFYLDSNEILPSFSMTSCTLYWKKDYLFSLVKYCYSSQIKVIVYKSCCELSLLVQCTLGTNLKVS